MSALFVAIAIVAFFCLCGLVEALMRPRNHRYPNDPQTHIGEDDE